MLVESVDFFRLDASRKLNPARRSELGQFMTPSATAQLMASMFAAERDEIELLDAGAGVGSLTAAFVDEICKRQRKPRRLQVTAYELEGSLVEYLRTTLDQCRNSCEAAGVDFESQVIEGDFVDHAARQLRQEMFAPVQRYACAILNPPYKKISSDSDTRMRLRELGIETSNLYTAFMAIAVMLLDLKGELVAITPRSFCNGPYFKPFRRMLLDSLTIRRIHIFESREIAFSEDDVLQENVVLHGVKNGSREIPVTITSSTGPDDDCFAVRQVGPAQLVRPGDPEYFIHVVPDEIGASVAEKMGRLSWSLEEHGLKISTGRVVDFRATAFLRESPEAATVPLIYPRNLANGFVAWPKPGGKKPQALALLPGSEELLVPKGTYVLVKRFSAKEETRRIVAALLDPARIDAEWIGLENHLNYFHRNGAGLPENLARGLSAFLNSTLVDMYFRQFSGHTQVNATDLRNLKYPTRSQLEALGSRLGERFPNQVELDALVEEALNLPEPAGVPDPVKAKKRMDEALAVLKELGVPREQQNERSALTLLSLLHLTPEVAWSDAKAPLMGITPMMEFFAQHYGKKYAPNTRETVRRQTIHQFLEAGIVVINPDKPDRPTNSPHAVYQVETILWKLLRSYGTRKWKAGLKAYLASVETLKQKYAQEREMKRIPIQISEGRIITLSPGGQNVLVERIIRDFCELFTAGGRLIYVGDTAEKWAYFDEALLASLGVTVDVHGKMPDVVIFLESKNWLVLIEAVTSHGPVNPKRRGELKTLFRGSKAGLVFVTAFLDRTSMVKYLSEISWETEVWVAEAPTHLIHFNGERFLGPYPESEEEV